MLQFYDSRSETNLGCLTIYLSISKYPAWRWNPQAETHQRYTKTAVQGVYRLYRHPWDWGTHWFTWNISMLCLL